LSFLRWLPVLNSSVCTPGVLRVEPRDMTVPKGSAFSAEKAAFDGFFMDVTLEDTHQKLERCALFNSVHCAIAALQQVRLCCIIASCMQ